MNINIQDNIAEISYQKGKRCFSKTVQLEALMSAFASQRGLTTPILPPGTVYYSKRGNEITVAIEIPAKRRGIHYVNSAGKTIFKGIIPLPLGLLKLVFRENENNILTLSGDAICALKRPLITMNDTVYHWPTPNVYGDKRICWGGSFKSAERTIANLSEAGKFIDIYFSSNFNTDLALGSRINMFDRYEDMLRAVTNQPIFDERILSPAGTFSQLL